MLFVFDDRIIMPLPESLARKIRNRHNFYLNMLQALHKKPSHLFKPYISLAKTHDGYRGFLYLKDSLIPLFVLEGTEEVIVHTRTVYLHKHEKLHESCTNEIVYIK